MAPSTSRGPSSGWARTATWRRDRWGGGERVDHGPTAIVRAKSVWLQLTTERDTFGLIDTDPIEQYGYETTAFDVVVSKSKTHFRAVFEALADSIVIVDAPESSPIDLTHFDSEYAPADLYPLSGY